MDLSHLLTFFGGIIADLLRKILLPQTEGWIERRIPSKRRERNARRNMVLLDVRERLTKMGHDPALASHVEEESDEFLRRLDAHQTAQREAFADVEADRLASQAQSQAEMNQVAFLRLGAADQFLVSATERFKSEVYLSRDALGAMDAAHRAWEAFREADAIFEGLAIADGGTMRPVVQAGVMESATVDRIARLNALRRQLGGK